jgi:hypothetical protein
MDFMVVAVEQEDQSLQQYQYLQQVQEVMVEVV